jgi:hypothetical protein
MLRQIKETEPNLYKEKPKTVKAVRYALDGSNAKYFTSHSTMWKDGKNILIDNGQRQYIVCPGDWVIFEQDILVLKHEDFKKHYELNA